MKNNSNKTAIHPPPRLRNEASSMLSLTSSFSFSSLQNPYSEPLFFCSCWFSSQFCHLWMCHSVTRVFLNSINGILLWVFFCSLLFCSVWCSQDSSTLMHVAAVHLFSLLYSIPTAWRDCSLFIHSPVNTSFSLFPCSLMLKTVLLWT